jgi:hypothetical protein
MSAGALVMTGVALCADAADGVTANTAQASAMVTMQVLCGRSELMREFI